MIARQVESTGWQRTHNRDRADLFIVNSCSVTAQSDRKSRQVITALHRLNPKAYVIVFGCFAQLQPQRVGGIPGVDRVVGAEFKSQLHELVPAPEKPLLKEKSTLIHHTEYKDIKSFCPSYSLNDRVRCFLKVQDGCNYPCTFCTIPKARGRSRSASIADTIKEVQFIIENGVKEIILTGVNAGDFGKPHGETFLELLQALARIEGLPRIRLSSVEPNLLTDECLELIATYPHFMPHFHLPLQSGSDEILLLMKRKYNTKTYASRIERILSLFPDAFIGIDVITGMHGETASHANQTFSFLRKLDFSELHVFPYSERQGTTATAFFPKIQPEERQERVDALQQLSLEKKRTFYQKFIGQERWVLFEKEDNNGRLNGYTDNYLRVSVAPHPQWQETIKRVKITADLIANSC